MDNELYSRACKAYFRTGDNKSAPCWGGSDVNWHDNNTATITLRNANGVLARYRYYSELGRLRRVNIEE
jgi:hypothetical protein